jgi:hypothetical protein
VLFALFFGGRCSAGLMSLLSNRLVRGWSASRPCLRGRSPSISCRARRGIGRPDWAVTGVYYDSGFLIGLKALSRPFSVASPFLDGRSFVFVGVAKPSSFWTSNFKVLVFR